MHFYKTLSIQVGKPQRPSNPVKGRPTPPSPFGPTLRSYPLNANSAALPFRSSPWASVMPHLLLLRPGDYKISPQPGAVAKERADRPTRRMPADPQTPDPPLFSSHRLGLQACTTTPGLVSAGDCTVLPERFLQSHKCVFKWSHPNRQRYCSTFLVLRVLSERELQKLKYVKDHPCGLCCSHF